MSGTSTGGKLAAKKNIEQYGKDFYAKIGAKGGKTPTSAPKGFAANRKLASMAGRKGGKNSRKNKK